MNDLKEITRQKAEAFLSLKAIGIIGISSNSKKFGNLVYKELKSKNINIYQIHHNLSFANEAPCYNSLEKIPEKIEGLLINVNRKKVKPILEEYFHKGIRHFWIQKGSESDEIIQFCKINNIEAIHGKCALMFAEPVTSIHKFHRIMWKWFGKS